MVLQSDGRLHVEDKIRLPKVEENTDKFKGHMTLNQDEYQKSVVKI